MFLVALSMVLIYFLQPILAPFLTGIIIGYLGDPLVDRLEEWKVNRTVGVLIVFVVFGAVLATALLIILPMIARELTALIRDIPVFFAWLQVTASPWIVENFGVDPFDVEFGQIADQVKDNWQQAGGIVGTVIARMTSSGFALLGYLWVQHPGESYP